MQVYRFELKRAFKTPGFVIALLIGSAIAMADWISLGLQYALKQEYWMSVDYTMKYPVSVYVSWIGGNDSKFSLLFFLVLPLLVVMPFAASFYQDNRNHFINYICTRTSQKSYFCAKFAATFISGGIVATVPLAVSFLLCAAVLPCTLPQVASSMILPKTTMAALYFSHPLLFFLLSILLVFVFAGTLAVSALYIAFYAKQIYSVVLYPFVLCLVIMSAADLLGVYYWQPVNFLNPVCMEPRMLPLMTETAILLAVALWEFLHNGKKQDILS